jgi:glycosyltransferase involved in cell wall biosynthesis
LVSIIVPTWQRQELITRCLPSVAVQTYPNLECLVVSDGPDEGFMEQMALNYPGKRMAFGCFESHRPGLRSGNEQRHHLVDKANGQYVAFLDDDDQWEPRHLSLVMAGMLEHNASYGYSKALMHMPGGGTQVIGTDPPSYGGITTSAIVAKTALCRRINWGDESAHGDWDLVSQWMNDNQTGYMSDEVSVHLFPASLGVIA